MSFFSSYKKIFLLGFIIVILIAIPFSVYIAGQRQNDNAKASASTTLSFMPAPVPAIAVGETVILDVWLDPGTGPTANQVSFVKLSIKFDPTKFATVSGSLAENLISNKLTSVLEGPTYTSGNVTISLSIGANPADYIGEKTKIAILKLQATNTTTAAGTSVTFDAPNIQVLSIASGDSTSENVVSLSSVSPANVVINSAAAGGTTPTPTSAPTSTAAPSPTSAPALGSGSNAVPSSSSIAPICSALQLVNDSTRGTAPYPLTFRATGSDSDGTISKISFNFGDTVQDLTVGGGIGTSSVSAELLHTYQAPGIYTAYAILTDDDSNVSAQQARCTKTITVSSTIPSGSSQQPIQTLPPTGNGDIMFGLGAVGVVFTIIGGALLLL